jgi:hypothetical protein
LSSLQSHGKSLRKKWCVESTDQSPEKGWIYHLFAIYLLFTTTMDAWMHCVGCNSTVHCCWMTRRNIIFCCSQTDRVPCRNWYKFYSCDIRHRIFVHKLPPTQIEGWNLFISVSLHAICNWIPLVSPVNGWMCQTVVMRARPER